MVKKLNIPKWQQAIICINGERNIYKISKIINCQYSHAYHLLKLLQQKGLIISTGLEGRNIKYDLTIKGHKLAIATRKMLEEYIKIDSPQT